MTAAKDVVQDPQTGEYVALHLYESKKVLCRAIFVGKAPWGARGATAGEAVDGRMVAYERGFKDKNFLHLLYHLVQEAIQNASPDSDVLSYCGDLALKMQDDGFTGYAPKITCPRCGTEREPRSPECVFPQETTYDWRVQSDKSNPRYEASRPCLGCYQKKLSEVREARDRAKERVRLTAHQIVEDNVYATDVVKPEAFSSVIAALELAVDEIVNGPRPMVELVRR